MKPSTSRPKACKAFRVLCALPLFLVLTVVFLELALGARLLAGWASDRGWTALGVCFKVAAIVTAVLTLTGIGVFFATWVAETARLVRGSELPEVKDARHQ
jgi:hypothetical protein